jgi:pyruvate/2-oxoglutarate dehydrogenase complex dihydrolipoamide acyltransferase (E2) component
MLEIIKMPKLGNEADEYEISQWFIKKGDVIHKGERLVEVLADKADMEIESEFSGKVIEIKEKEGAVVSVGSDLVVIDTL